MVNSDQKDLQAKMFDKVFYTVHVCTSVVDTFVEETPGCCDGVHPSIHNSFRVMIESIQRSLLKDRNIYHQNFSKSSFNF